MNRIELTLCPIQKPYSFYIFMNNKWEFHVARDNNVLKLTNQPINQKKNGGGVITARCEAQVTNSFSIVWN